LQQVSKDLHFKQGLTQQPFISLGLLAEGGTAAVILNAVTRWEAGWAPEPLWTLYRGEKIFTCARN
jgi:hypothetical protein